MANDTTDVLMTFIGDGGPVQAECRTRWEPNDKMHDDFVNGCYFEVEDFTLGFGLESDDSASDNQNQLPPGTSTPSGKHGSGKMMPRSNKFAKYILEGSLDYPIDAQEVSVSRQIDKASPTLLYNCLNLIPFKKAVIVKRKVVGGVSGDGKASGKDANMHHMGFLRFDFGEPLLTGVEWEDGEVVKEKLKFIFTSLNVQYCPQDDSGSLAAAIPLPQGPWETKNGLKK